MLDFYNEMSNHHSSHLSQKKKKIQADKPGSVSLSRPDNYRDQDKGLIIYLAVPLPTRSSCLPSHIGREPSKASVHDISPHRVYLISLQHYLYILSVALVLSRSR